jgi:hypothetical protein
MFDFPAPVKAMGWQNESSPLRGQIKSVFMDGQFVLLDKKSQSRYDGSSKEVR